MPTLILLTERKVSACSHPSRRGQTVNAADAHGECKLAPVCNSVHKDRSDSGTRPGRLGGRFRVLAGFPLPMT
nr:MAG TPA: hypothetical protein [Caudoviricetes sp.]